MFKPTPFVTSIVLVLSIAQLANSQPQKPSQPTRSTQNPSQPMRSDEATLCYVRTSDGQTRDLTRFCGTQKTTPSNQQLAESDGKVKICYGLDDQYFPCPTDE
jgi:hypothetical protein